MPFRTLGCEHERCRILGITVVCDERQKMRWAFGEKKEGALKESERILR